MSSPLRRFGLAATLWALLVALLPLPVAGERGADPMESFGRLLWKFKTGGFVDSAPAAAGGSVFFGSWDGRFYALDDATGEPRWSFEAGDFVDSAPATAGGRVYFCSWDRAVHCLDARTGKKLWAFRMAPSRKDDHRQSSPSVADGRVYVGGYDGSLYALDERTGKKVWEFPTGGAIRSRPHPDGFVGSEDGTVYAFDRRSGQRRWLFRAGGPVHSAPAAGGGRVYFGSRDGKVYCLDAGRGTTLWVYDTGSRVEYSAPLVSSGVVFIGDCGGTLHAIDGREGKALWVRRGADSIYSTPVAVNGVIACGDNSGRVFFLDPRTGALLGVFRAGGAVQALAAGPGGMLLIGSRDHFVYALSIPGAAEPIVASGIVAKDAVWEGTVRVEGTVTVAREALLTVRPGTVVRFGGGAGLVVEGRLVAEGTEKEPIRFEPGDPQAAAGAWAGIRFAGARDGSVLAHGRVAGAAALRVEGCSPAIRNCAISKGVDGLRIERNAAPEIAGNAIEGLTGTAIVVEKDSAPVVSGNSIGPCGGAGILAAEGAGPALRGNTVSGCEVGILVTGIVPPVERNVLRKNKRGMVIQRTGPETVIRGNRFVENGTGLACSQFASPLVEGNEFTGNDDGLLCFRTSSPLVRHNEFAGNRQGIACVNISSPRIVANDIHDNRKGIYLTLSSYAAVHGNNIRGNGVQLELGNMSSDWERRVARKPARGALAQAQELVGRGRATARDLGKAAGDDGAVIMGFVDATGNWWGEDGTAEMERKGPDANIEGLRDGRDVPTLTYEGYPGEYVQDRIKYDGWMKSRIGDAGIR